MTLFTTCWWNLWSILGVVLGVERLPLQPRRPRLLFTAVAALALLGACTSATGEPAGLARSTTSAPSTTTSTTPPTTAAPTTTAPPPPQAGLAPGAKGPEVEALQRQLEAMKFSPGKIDGVYAQMTVHAVMAFQKTFGLPRTGKADPETLARISEAPVVEPMLPTGGATRIEVDLKRQMLALYVDGTLYKVLSVSTGTNKRYCEKGKCGVAVTPGGSYRVTWRHKGIRVAPLGKLWNPLFFNGGIAIHGSPSVPAGPASHGCVRIPIPDSEWFFAVVPPRTPVYVVNGSRPAVAFEEAPQESTTTTAAPTTTAPATPSTTTTAPPAPTTPTTAPPSTTTPPPSP